MTTDQKAPRVRSVAYPSLDLMQCVELTSEIHKIFGNITYTSRDSIAKQLGISESTLQTQVSSCVQFGLLELRSKEGYKPSDLFIKVKSPLPNENVYSFYVIMFTNPPLYKELVEQFNGKQLPLEAGLATILYRMHKVSEKAAGFAARIFIESAIRCNFLSEHDWVLRVEEKHLKNDEIEIIEEKKDDQVLYLPEKITSIGHRLEDMLSETIEILLDNGRKARLVMPKDYTKKDLDRVMKIVGVYME